MNKSIAQVLATDQSASAIEKGEMQMPRMDFLVFSKMCARLSVAVTVICGAAVIAAPHDVLSTSPVFNSFSAWMRSLVPVIDAYTKRSQFPEITQLYMSVMLVCSPIFFLGAFHALRNKDGTVFVRLQDCDRRKDVSKASYLFASIGLATFLPLIAYFHIAWNPGIDPYSFMEYSKSRIALALFGWFITGGMAYGLGCSLLVMGRTSLSISDFFKK